MQQFRDVVISPTGRPIPGATVTVTLAAGGTPTLYSADGSSALGSNVITTDSGGEWKFYAANGRYSASIVAAGYTTTTRDIVLFDPQDAGRYAPGQFNSAASADFQGAILDLNATTGGVITLPPGDVLISPMSFTSRHNITIEGAGISATTISVASVGTGLTFSDCQWLKLRDLTVKLNGTAQAIASTYGVRLDTGSGNAEIDRVLFQGFAEDGLQLVGTAGTPLSGIKVRDSYFLGNGGRQLYSQYSNDYHYTGNQFGRLAAVALADYGAYLNESSAGTYAENYHWDNGIGCVNNSANYSTVVNNRFEESQTNGYFQNGGSNLIFTGNKIHTNSKASSGASDGVYITNVSKYLIDDNHVFSMDATRHDNDINIDVGCEDGTIGKNSMSAYTRAPIRVVGGLTTPPSSSIGFSFSSNSTVAAGATVYLGVNGVSATEGDVYTLAQRKTVAVRLYVSSVAAPGSGQSFTYTVRKNGGDTGMVATISDGGFASVTMGGATPVLFGMDDVITVKLVTSASAAVTNHRVQLIPVEY